eukprot:3058472-Prymnesium_polylepis.1
MPCCEHLVEFGQESEHSSHLDLFTPIRKFSETAKVPSETGVLAPKSQNAGAVSQFLTFSHG